MGNPSAIYFDSIIKLVSIADWQQTRQHTKPVSAIPGMTEVWLEMRRRLLSMILDAYSVGKEKNIGEIPVKIKIIAFF